MNPKEEKKLREELAYRKKWDMIHNKTYLISTLILFLILLGALWKRWFP